MLSKKELFIKTIKDIDEVTNYFYKQKNKEGYENLDRVLGNISLSVDSIFAYKVENSLIEFNEARLISNLTEAMKAIEEQDTILLADILHYEILEQFQYIEKQL